MLHINYRLRLILQYIDISECLIAAHFLRRRSQAMLVNVLQLV